MCIGTGLTSNGVGPRIPVNHQQELSADIHLRRVFLRTSGGTIVEYEAVDAHRGGGKPR